jgi:Tfp pilus assembly protein PilN
VIGALAVLLVMAVVYTLTSNQVNSRASQAAKAKQEADSLEARANSLGAYGSFAQVKRTRTDSVKQLAAGRFDWERMMRELAAVLPEGGWVQEANASLSGGTEGQAAQSTAPAKPTLAIKGCLAKQSTVAAFMVRLRRLYLVEDVALNESVSKGVQGAAGDPNANKPTLDNCGRMYAFDLTVTFKAAAPTGKEAPLGRDAVPARLGGGS